METEMKPMNWPSAPYVVGGAVYDDRRFAGRSQLLAELRSLAEDEYREGFILSGPRRSGKSSVLERLAKILALEMRVVKIDMLAILGAGDDWTHRASWRTGAVTLTVLQSLLEVMERDFDVSLESCRHSLDPLAFDINEFRRTALPELQSICGGKRLVILFDEVEVAEAINPSSPAEIVGSLQPVANTRGPKPFLGLIWGRPFGMGQARKLPTRLKDFTRRELQRFTLEEVEEALQKPLGGCYRWADEAVSAVWELTSGHPLFLEALGAVAHSKRHVGDDRPVSAHDVRGSVEEGLRYADGWEDAWSQLSSKQQILLRALAEYPADSEITAVLSATRGWGAPYDQSDFEPFIQSLVEDGLLTSGVSGIGFQVPMISRWIYRIPPSRILGTPEDQTTGLIANAGRYEQEGRHLYELGKVDAAAASFQEALELDPKRWSAAVWLGQILLGKGQPEVAAKMLRKASPTAEVRRIRAQALTQCLRDALENHTDPRSFVDELRTIDPLFREEPAAVPLVARAYIEEWWQLLSATTAPEKAKEATDRLVLGPGARFINEALKRARFEVERKLELGSGFNELLAVTLCALPYLLRESEPSLFVETSGHTDNDMADGYSAQWERCYSAEISALETMAATAQIESDRSTALALLHLLECRAARTSLGDPLRKLVLATATTDRLKEISFSDSAGARLFGALLEHIDDSEGIRRLHEVFTDTALAAATAEPVRVKEAMSSLSAICASELRCLQRRDVAIPSDADRRDLKDAIVLLFDRLEEDTACASVALVGTAQEDWSGLLPLFKDVAPDEINHILAWLESRQQGETAAETPSLLSKLNRRIDSATVQQILGAAYEVERPLPYRIHGVPPGYIWAWSVNRLGRHLLARAYRVEGGDASVQTFLMHLWENERRLLSTLGTRWEGRALPHLYVSRFEPKRGVLILVTEFTGTQTLRDLLTRGEISRMRSASRAKLWSHLQGIVEALAALHRSGYIHRAVRPENILVDFDGHNTSGKPWLRLANFEWSVYLYSLAEAVTTESRFLDRYISPERLAVHRPSSTFASFVGEGPGSDSFNLGLLLYECLLEPLRPEELRPLPDIYSASDHKTWVEILRERVIGALNNGQLWSDEVDLLLKLLHPDPLLRCADIDSILDIVSRLAQQELPEASEIDSPLHVVTTLEIGTKESIARYILEDLPDVHFTDTASLRKWLEEQLAGATIRPNRRAGAAIHRRTISEFHC